MDAAFNDDVVVISGLIFGFSLLFGNLSLETGSNPTAAMRSAFRASDNLFNAIACERPGDFRINCLDGVLGLVLLIVVVVWLVGGGGHI